MLPSLSYPSLLTKPWSFLVFAHSNPSVPYTPQLTFSAPWLISQVACFSIELFPRFAGTWIAMRFSFGVVGLQVRGFFLSVVFARSCFVSVTFSGCFWACGFLWVIFELLMSLERFTVCVILSCHMMYPMILLSRPYKFEFVSLVTYFGFLVFWSPPWATWQFFRVFQTFPCSIPPHKWFSFFEWGTWRGFNRVWESQMVWIGWASWWGRWSLISTWTWILEMGCKKLMIILYE